MLSPSGRDRRTLLRVVFGMFAIGTAAAVTLMLGPTTSERLASDRVELPNPMGGPARPAPGETSGVIELAALRIDGTEIHMGEVALGVTFVPAWTVENPTNAPIVMTIGQPQVLTGCCPGPVYVDGALIGADHQVIVRAGSSALVQFPLQMHAGMDGPHHLAVPLTVGSATATLEVTADFSARMRA